MKHRPDVTPRLRPGYAPLAIAVPGHLANERQMMPRNVPSGATWRRSAAMLEIWVPVKR